MIMIYVKRVNYCQLTVKHVMSLFVGSCLSPLCCPHTLYVLESPLVKISIKWIPITTPSQPLCAGPSGPGIPAEGLW